MHSLSVDSKRVVHRLYQNEVQLTHTYSYTDFPFQMTDNNVKIVFKSKRYRSSKMECHVWW